MISNSVLIMLGNFFLILFFDFDRLDLRPHNCAKPHVSVSEGPEFAPDVLASVIRELPEQVRPGSGLLRFCSNLSTKLLRLIYGQLGSSCWAYYQELIPFFGPPMTILLWQNSLQCSEPELSKKLQISMAKDLFAVNKWNLWIFRYFAKDLAKGEISRVLRWHPPSACLPIWRLTCWKKCCPYHRMKGAQPKPR